MRIPGVRVPVSRVVFGTDWLGARSFVYVRGRRISSPFINARRNRDNFALLDGVFDAGGTAFDTARAYGDSERTLGDWMHDRGVRERVAIITKGAHPGPGWISRLSSREITRDLERSLKALRTDYLDVYLLHYDDGVAEVGPLIDLLNAQVAAGRIRAFGMSNWPIGRIDHAARYAAASAQRPPAVSSVQLSLAAWQQAPWQDALSISGDDSVHERQWYRRSEIWLLAYSSLAMGFFSRSRPYADGRRDRAAPVTFGDRVFLNPGNLARLARATALARQLGVSPGQIALAWVLRFSERVLPIVGARSVASYADAVRACEIPLTETQRDWLAHGSGEASDHESADR